MTVFPLSVVSTSVVYFVVLLVYVKQLLSGGWIWFFFAGVYLVNALLRYLRAKSLARISLFFLTFARTISPFNMVILTTIDIVTVSGMRPEEKGGSEYAIMFDARLRPDRTSSKTIWESLTELVEDDFDHEMPVSCTYF